MFEEIDYILDRPNEVADEHGIAIETVMASFGLNAAKGVPAGDQNIDKENVPPSGRDARTNDAGGPGHFPAHAAAPGGGALVVEQSPAGVRFQGNGRGRCRDS